MSGSRVTLPRRVRKDLPGFVVAGHLYRHGDVHLLVYTAGDGKQWDACLTDPATLNFTPVIARGRGLRNCLEQVVEVLG